MEEEEEEEEEEEASPPCWSQVTPDGIVNPISPQIMSQLDLTNE